MTRKCLHSQGLKLEMLKKGWKQQHKWHQNDSEENSLRCLSSSMFVEDNLEVADVVTKILDITSFLRFVCSLYNDLCNIQTFLRLSRCFSFEKPHHGLSKQSWSWWSHCRGVQYRWRMQEGWERWEGPYQRLTQKDSWAFFKRPNSLPVVIALNGWWFVRESYPKMALILVKDL